MGCCSSSRVRDRESALERAVELHGFERLPFCWRADREVALAAVASWGFNLRYVSDELKSDREVVLTAVAQNGLALKYASTEMRADREVVLTAVAQYGRALEYASTVLRADKEVVLTAVAQDGLALMYASTEMRADREVVLTAVRKYGNALYYASTEMRADREVVLTAVADVGYALKYASTDMPADKEVVLTAVRQDGRFLEYASTDLRADKEVVMAAVAEDGRALEFASDQLRADREIVRAAVEQGNKHGRGLTVLKYAEPPLNQDAEMLKLAGVLVEKPRISEDAFKPELVLSVKFSLAKEASDLANQLFQKITTDHRFEQMYVHNPNVFRKGFCGLTYKPSTGSSYVEDGRTVYGWDDNLLAWTCRGNCGCKCWKQKEDPSHNCTKEHPNDQFKYGCWRYVFRRHLEKAKSTGGLMLQLQEFGGLGVGQQVEREMAKEVGVDVIVMERIWASDMNALAELLRDVNKGLSYPFSSGRFPGGNFVYRLKD